MILASIATLSKPAEYPRSELINVAVMAKSGNVQHFNNVRPSFKFKEAIVSWNVADLGAGTLTVEARARSEKGESKWFTMAVWSIGPERHSVKNQGDNWGTVNTDTLELKQYAASLDLRLTFVGSTVPKLKLLSVCFTDPTGGKASTSEHSRAWGKSVDVPEKAQGNYPRGGVLCSATSTSMMLCHAARTLQRPELELDVPEAQVAIWDPVYDGAGNWAFNVAWFGSFPGLRGYVARLNSISDLERWIVVGIPVVCSVSFDLLRGKPLSTTEAGHLVVLVGFTSDGDPVFNDPARTNQIRTVYARSDFEKAWLYSRRAVYVMTSSEVPTPSGSHAWVSD